MPTNLPPQYFDVEKKLKTASAAEDKIPIMEELLSIIPKHKGTEKLRAMWKTKIAKQRSASQKKASAAKHVASHTIRPSGAGQVVLVGPPNCGKSSLVKALTNADPQVSDYPYTTVEPCPAMMPFENIQIQLVDTPPVSQEYMETWFPDLVRGADGVLLVLDMAVQDPPSDMRAVIQKLAEKRVGLKGDITSTTGESGLMLMNKKTMVVANKIDIAGAAARLENLSHSLAGEFPLIAVSAQHRDRLTELNRKTYEMLDIIRVYSKAPGKKAQISDPFTLRRGSNVTDMARAVHKDFASKLKFARIWGKNKYQGQRVNRDYIMVDEDVIELHM